MPGFARFIIGLEIFLLIAAVIAIIVLIFRRIEIRKKEDFEKRNN